MEITIPVAMLMSAGSTLTGMAGTWAVLKYKVERATASAEAAHRRLNEQHEEHDGLKDRVLIVEQEQKSQGKELERITRQIAEQLDKLDKKLDAVIAGRKQ